MRLYAGLMPPEPILQDLDALVRSAGGDPSELDRVPVHEMHIPLSLFGNVSLRDATLLEDTLTREAKHWAPVELRFAGATALEWTGDLSVWAKLGGDTEELAAIARNVTAAVQRLGFFVDRRKFRTWMSVGDVTGSTTPEFLHHLVDGMEAYDGPTWTLDELCLLTGRRSDDDETMSVEVYQRIPLSG